MSPAPITLDERVADVLARDEGLIDVFERASPAFSRLRNPALRKVMTRLVTVGQAARVAGVDAQQLLSALNRAVGARDDEDPGPEADAPESTGAVKANSTNQATTMSSDPNTTPSTTPPPGFPPELVVELDVREDLRQGREPFSRIMAAKREVPEGGALKLRAIFEPAPLYAVLAKQGFAHHAEQVGPEDWVVWFWSEEVDADTVRAREPAGDAAATGEAGAPGTGSGVVVLDVRGLEPPEPMVRTLAALESLPPGDTLVQINVREPRFLLPQLEERGFVYEIREQAEDLVRVFIRHGETE